jgi:hypothetical protein
LKIEEIIDSSIESDKIVSPSSLYLKFQDLSPEEKRYLDNQDKKRLGLLDEEKKKTAVNIHTISENKFFMNLEKFKQNQNIIKESFKSYNKKPERVFNFNFHENSPNLLPSKV